LNAPIGVFDSGVGGLTVLRALREAMPAENFIYLGDTARLPYGTKSAETVVRYSLQCAAVLATEGTIAQGAYQTAIHRLNPRARVTSRACSLFVAMAEEGWTEGPIAEAVARRYLDPMFQKRDAPDTLVLGCTHFPALAAALRAVLPPHVGIVDSAATTAAAVRRRLEGKSGASNAPGAVSWLATDGAARFARVGSTFLGETLHAETVEIIDL
jgi:glutamate racemase